MEAYCYSVLYFWQVGFGFLSPPALVTTGMCGLLPIHFYLSDIPKLFCLSLSATCQDILSIIQTLPGSSVLLGLVQTKRILDKVHEEKQLFFLIKTKPQPLPCENHPPRDWSPPRPSSAPPFILRTGDYVSPPMSSPYRWGNWNQPWPWDRP